VYVHTVENVALALKDARESPRLPAAAAIPKQKGAYFASFLMIVGACAFCCFWVFAEQICKPIPSKQEPHLPV
jgi:hypothetical protein